MNAPSIEKIKDHYKNKNLKELYNLSVACNHYVLKNTDITHQFDGYSLRDLSTNSSKQSRPINNELFISQNFEQFGNDIDHYFSRPFRPEELENRLIQRQIIYTIQQSVGAYLDLIADQQQARKLAGEFFQGLINQLLKCKYQVNSGAISFNISESDKIDTNVRSAAISSAKDNKVRLSFDLLIRPQNSKISNNSNLSPPCIVCGVKTTTKDRGNMFFIDKYLYERTHSHRPNFIAVVQNDVQRVRKNGKTIGISYTFLNGHNRLYNFILGNLDGYYFVDPPPIVQTEISKQRFNLNLIDKMLNDDIPKWFSKYGPPTPL